MLINNLPEVQNLREVCYFTLLHPQTDNITMPPDPRTITCSFVEMINSRNPEGLRDLMAENHLFTDSLGQTVEGKETMYAAWKDYFRMAPDYEIVCEKMLRSGNTVVILGRARGTCAFEGRLSPANHWEIPAAWKAVIRKNRVAQWQVYADNEPVRRILAAAKF